MPLIFDCWGYPVAALDPCNALSQCSHYKDIARVFNGYPDIKKNIRFPWLLWGYAPFERGFLLSISKRFLLSYFFKSIFCHKTARPTQHKLIQDDETAAVNFLLNKVQRWLIKGLLESHHYSHFSLKTLTEKHHYVLNFADVAISCGDAEAFPYCGRVSWGDLSMMISRQGERCILRDKSQQ